MISPTLKPQLDDATSSGKRWKTVIFNNETTAYQVVVAVLMVATGCDQQEAEIETWEAHVYGKAAVHFAEQGTCEAIAKIIQTVGVATEVVPEWEDEE
jgi:ATP-dependent Clp protease adapter protein ClpS